MAFWLSVLIGFAVAAIAVKIGFFESFTHFCNALVAIYLSIFLTPTVLQLAPDAANIPAGIALTSTVLALIVFASLWALSFFLITGQFTVPFPKIFDVLCAGGLGFLLGFLVVSFALVAVVDSSTPYVSALINNDQITSNTRFVCWWCDRVHRFVGTTDSSQPTSEAIARLAELRQSQSPPRPSPLHNDSNSPPPLHQG